MEMERINKITQKENNYRVARRLIMAADMVNRISENEHIAHKENSSTHLVGDSHACINCYQTITNPICEKCYLKHLRIWLNEHISDPKISNKIILKLHQRVSSEALNDVDCILCGKEDVSICTYCFFFSAENIMSKSKVSKSLLSEFSQTFNYHIYHIKYF